MHCSPSLFWGEGQQGGAAVTLFERLAQPPRGLADDHFLLFLAVVFPDLSPAEGGAMGDGL